MCDLQGGPDNSLAGAIIFLGELNTFSRIQSDNQKRPNDDTRQISTSMTWK